MPKQETGIGLSFVDLMYSGEMKSEPQKKIINLITVTMDKYTTRGIRADMISTCL